MKQVAARQSALARKDTLAKALSHGPMASSWTQTQIIEVLKRRRWRLIRGAQLTQTAYGRNCPRAMYGSWMVMRHTPDEGWRWIALGNSASAAFRQALARYPEATA